MLPTIVALAKYSPLPNSPAAAPPTCEALRRFLCSPDTPKHSSALCLDASKVFRTGHLSPDLMDPSLFEQLWYGNEPAMLPLVSLSAFLLAFLFAALLARLSCFAIGVTGPLGGSFILLGRPFR